MRKKAFARGVIQAMMKSAYDPDDPRYQAENTDTWIRLLNSGNYPNLGPLGAPKKLRDVPEALKARFLHGLRGVDHWFADTFGGKPTFKESLYFDKHPWLGSRGSRGGPLSGPLQALGTLGDKMEGMPEDIMKEIRKDPRFPGNK